MRMIFFFSYRQSALSKHSKNWNLGNCKALVFCETVLWPVHVAIIPNLMALRYTQLYRL